MRRWSNKGAGVVGGEARGLIEADLVVGAASVEVWAPSDEGAVCASGAFADEQRGPGCGPQAACSWGCRPRSTA
jgi:hypothetical protein